MKPTRPTKITDVDTKVSADGCTTELYTRKNGLKHLVLTIDNPGETAKLIIDSLGDAKIDNKQS